MTELEAYDCVLAYVIGRYVTDPSEKLLRCTPRMPELALEYPNVVRDAINVLHVREERILNGGDPGGCSYNSGVRVGVLLATRGVVGLFNELVCDHLTKGTPLVEDLVASFEGCLDACDEDERKIREGA